MSAPELESGSRPGWIIAGQPNGSWAWNVGDGKARRDYQPTHERQPINDGGWHHLAFSIRHDRHEARLYYDGRNVAIYDLTGMGNLTGKLPVCIGADGTGERSTVPYSGSVDELKIHGKALTDGEIRASSQQYRPRAESTVKADEPLHELRILAITNVPGP